MTAPAASQSARPADSPESAIGALNAKTRQRQRMLLLGGGGAIAMAGLWFVLGGSPHHAATTPDAPQRIETDGIVNRDLSQKEFVAIYGNRLVVARGTRVNPLDTVPLRQRLVFIDGDDQDQVAWAMARTTALDAKVILVGGSPFALMKAEQRRFYFDQSGTLTTKLGIHAVPAVVEQRGRVLAVRELVIQGTKGDRK